jgi:hypothetical protein
VLSNVLSKLTNPDTALVALDSSVEIEHRMVPSSFPVPVWPVTVRVIAGRFTVAPFRDMLIGDVVRFKTVQVLEALATGADTA